MFSDQLLIEGWEKPAPSRRGSPNGTIVMLTDVGDATMAEAVARLNLSVPGAKSRAQRVRVRLQKLFIDCCSVEFDATSAWRRASPLLLQITTSLGY